MAFLNVWSWAPKASSAGLMELDLGIGFSDSGVLRLKCAVSEKIGGRRMFHARAGMWDACVAMPDAGAAKSDACASMAVAGRRDAGRVRGQGGRGGGDESGGLRPASPRAA